MLVVELNFKSSYDWSFKISNTSKLMSKYYCPYCSPRYQFYKQGADGIMICGQCGEPLLKVPFIRPVQIIALIAMTAFVAPLIFILFMNINNLNKPEPGRNNESLANILV